jgi:type I restriction enzyme S subunit
MRQAKIEEQYFTIDQFETDYVLPEGWAAGILEELIGRGGILTDGDWIESKDQDPHGDVRLIQLADIGDGYYKDKSSRFLTSEKAKELGCTFLEKGDVLIARMPEPLGRTCIFPGDPKPVVTAVDICIIRTGDDGADHRWIMHTVNSPEIRRRIESLQKGTTRKRISRRNLASLTLPIPPFNEQRRIAVKVEELLARVNATKDRLAKVSMILKRFRQAVLAVACSGRLTADWRKENQTEDVPESSELPPRWRWMPIKELLPPSGIFDGPFGSNLKTADYTDNGVRVVRLENVGFLQFFHQKETYISQEKYKILSKHTVGAGDIIFASFIDEEVRACVLPKLKTKAIAKADCFCVRPRQDIVDRHYLTLQFVSRESYERLSENIHGATRPRINTTHLRNLEVRICPLAEQQEIVRRVEALFKLADSIEKRVAVATARAEKLTQAILAKAFRGELVPTEAELARREGRSYESASELLARIKSERESKGIIQKRRYNKTYIGDP